MAKEPAEINPAGIRISRESGVPLYTQVYTQFREMILSRRLRPGERLPASRNLAITIGVSRVIVSQAYEQLMMEGYLVGRTGSGTFVADTIPDHLLQAGASSRVGAAPQTGASPQDGTSCDFSPKSNRLVIEPFRSGAPSLDRFPYNAWQQVGSKALKSLKGIHLGYEDTLGYWPLRKAIASYLRLSRAVICEAEQVIVVTGSQQGLSLATAGLLREGDDVWLEDPGYHGAREAFKYAGIRVCPVPVREDGMDLDYAISHYPDAKLAYVTPSHQFPLGYTLSHDRRLQLLEWAAKMNMWIFEDDYDSEFRYEGRPLECLQGLDSNRKVIYSGTFSKVLFPGLRLAYLVAPSPTLLENFKRIKANLDRHSPIMEQVILSGFMEEGYFLRHIRKMRLLYAERQQILIRLLQDDALKDHIRVDVRPSGMDLVCWLSERIDIRRLKKETRERGLIISFGDFYTQENSLPPVMFLGYTAFSKYKLKTAVEKLTECVRLSLK